MSSKDKLTVEQIDGTRPSPPTPRRSVSFGVEDSIAPAPLSPEELSKAMNATTSGISGTPNSTFATTSAAMAPAGSSSSSLNPSPATLRSALKPSASAYKKLPPPEQYQHRDPLLRRLRLVDENGKPVNLKQRFGNDVKCIGFYFSSQWAGQPLKEYHKTITEFCQRHPHEFKIIYVSVDVDEQWYKAGVKGKPWVSMVWNDGSSAPAGPGAEGNDKPNKEAGEDDAARGAGRATLHNGEDFLLGGEPDIDESLSHSDTSGEAYLRPFSRVHLASKLNIIAAPTLCVYHLPTGKMLDRNVRMTKLRPGQEEGAWERWKNGEKTASAGFLDAAQQRPTTIIMLILSILYYLWVRFTGPEYNFLQQGMIQIANRLNPAHVQQGLQQGSQPALSSPAAALFE